MCKCARNISQTFLEKNWNFQAFCQIFVRNRATWKIRNAVQSLFKSTEWQNNFGLIELYENSTVKFQLIFVQVKSANKK